jgi:ribosomal protein L14E/L6E/L27E
MTTFKLRKVTANHVKTTFHILNEANGDIVGSVSVTNREIPALLRCWAGATNAATVQASAAAKQDRPIQAMLAAARRRRPVNKAALRGCP